MEDGYKIIGGDGREYGPADLPDLRRWIEEGRVDWSTLVWLAEEERWKPAKDVPEILEDLARRGAHRVTSAVNSGTLLVPAPFIARVAAYGLDRILIVLIAYLVVGPPKAQWMAQENLSNYIAMAGISVIYFTLMTRQRGATIGKSMMGLMVVNQTGVRPALSECLNRALFMLVSELIFFIGFVMAAYRPDQKALHDLTAGTQVVVNPESPWFRKSDDNRN